MTFIKMENTPNYVYLWTSVGDTSISHMEELLFLLRFQIPYNMYPTEMNTVVFYLLRDKGYLLWNHIGLKSN